MVHDLYYRYGFDEVAGNFQNHNFGKGGKENDAVIAYAQDSHQISGGLFIAPADGERPIMHIYLQKGATPVRDGDFDAGLVIHEYTHGLSSRLTGGPMDPNCLFEIETAGLSEGWGDFMATTIRSTSIYSDYPIGAWSSNKKTGVRPYLYSLDKGVNPTTYKTVDGYTDPHDIGAVYV